MVLRPSSKGTKISLPTFLLIHFSLSIAIVIYTIVRGYEIRTEQTQIYAEKLLQTIIEGQNSISDESKAILTAWSEDIKLRNIPLADTCGSDIIKASASNKERYTVYGTVDTDGNIVCANIPLDKATNAGDRRYIQDALSKKVFSASEYQIGKVSKKPSVNFAYPILDKNGTAEGALVIGLSLDWLNETITNMNLPEGAGIMITDRFGTILASFPSNGNFTGTTKFDAQIFSIILARKRGFIERTGSDNVTRIYTYSASYGTEEREPDSFIIVALPRDVLFDPVNRLTKTAVSFVLVTFAIEIVLARHLMKSYT